MSSCRIGRLFTAGCAALLIISCTVPQPKPVLPIVRVKSTDDLFEKTKAKNPVHDVLRGQARVSVSSLSDKYRVTEMVFAKRPSSLRLETIGPLGQTLLFLATDLKKVFIYSPTENRYYFGLASKKNLSLLVPLPFKAADIIELLQGRVDLDNYYPRSMSFDEIKGIYELTISPLEPGRGMALLTVDGRTFSILAMKLYYSDNNLIIDGAFSDFDTATNTAVPMTIAYKVPDEGTFVKIGIEYADLDVNAPIDDSRFVLDPPRGVQEIDLDKSIINFNRTPIQ
jgi:outer membrane lipoprotein-sorting protein